MRCSKQEQAKTVMRAMTDVLLHLATNSESRARNKIERVKAARQGCDHATHLGGIDEDGNKAAVR